MEWVDAVVIGAGLAGRESDLWVCGYMEGAVRTGRQAAAAALDNR